MRNSANLTNRLKEESSPYLLQHANNPVHWQPWDNTALQYAKSAGKPILLSIGYSACHWCHVMARESFENPQIAEMMNDLFICVKVDREERPDLDKIYQLAHQMLTQRPGGWPLTVALTPAGHAPFFAGTYFPPEPRMNMPGFGDLLNQIANHFTRKKRRCPTITFLSRAPSISSTQNRLKPLFLTIFCCLNLPLRFYNSNMTRHLADLEMRRSFHTPPNLNCYYYLLAVPPIFLDWLKA